jgi:hypothetical protein
MTRPIGVVMKIVKARKQHICTETSWHNIEVGDRYLYCSLPPWKEPNTGEKFWVMKACLRCAEEYALHNSETRKQLQDMEKA